MLGDDWTKVGNVSRSTDSHTIRLCMSCAGYRLSPNDPKCLVLAGRQVTVVLTADGMVRCFDSFCYHFGGQVAGRLGAAADSVPAAGQERLHFYRRHRGLGYASSHSLSRPRQNGAAPHHNPPTDPLHPQPAAPSHDRLLPRMTDCPLRLPPRRSR